MPSPSFYSFIIALISALSIAACTPTPSNTEKQRVLEAHRQLAFTVYSETVLKTQRLYNEIPNFTAAPSEQKLLHLRQLWIEARAPYSQSEALRFGNWFTDEWDGKVNSWPLDEGLIDYVDSSYIASTTNPWAQMNLIGSEQIQLLTRPISTRKLSIALLRLLSSESDVETNVLSGFHALEFMLWGQDTSNSQARAGQRPWTDFLAQDGKCTNSNSLAGSATSCRKRGEFLLIVTKDLLERLEEMRDHWAPSNSPRAELVAGEANAGLARMLFGLSTMSAQELAGERIQVALYTSAPEEEQDCFSDDTHHSIWYNALGIENFYFGRFESTDPARSVNLAQHSLAELTKKYYPALSTQLEQAFTQTRKITKQLKDMGDAPSEHRQHFDQLIRSENKEGRALLAELVLTLEHQANLLKQLANRITLDLDHPGTTPNSTLEQ
ncbi:hypothetical protein IB286_14560 [Spongiibacter sp. KMU-158]|uniref:Imelysin-like domain-containing protein n=1 Tax=Spongiibacter pelagi TaxID=2760804 RepID=A0A927C2Q3_9GAMM|nr:imelysin family protein [Spongiibacter pelagi]MBD2860220.1 hypothetical protein [Spongiibacter pelagi]